MQITDQQFIDALHKVCDDSPNKQAPGAYFNNGEAYCVVGKALASIEESLCPRNNTLLADRLLTHYGCSSKVATAGMLAQYVNDQGEVWSEVKAAFDWALEFAPVGVPTYELVVRYRMSKDPGMYGPMKTYASGGYISATVASPVSLVGCNCGACSLFNGSKATTTFPAVLAQKDHALTA